MREHEAVNKSMGAALANEFVRKFYAEGNIAGAMEQASENIVAFGTQSMKYAVGKKEVQQCLQEEHALVAPCRLFRSKLKEYPQEDMCAVMGSVILRTTSEYSTILHQITLMYQKEKDDYRLTGIHLVRNLHHEGTYRMICSNMLSGLMEKRHSHHKSPESNILSSHVHSAFVTFRMSDERPMTFYSDELWSMLGYISGDKFIRETGEKLTELIVEDFREDVLQSMRRQLTYKDVYQVEYPMRGADGRTTWIVECGRRFERPDGRQMYNGILLDITPLKQASETLAYQVSYDELTGLYNKTAFCQKVQELLETQPDRNFEIMCLDIERFKVINDLFGEEVGDRILRYFAAFFREMKLESGVYARIHSDRFIMFYPSEGRNRERFIKSLKLLASSFTLGYRVMLRFGVYVIDDRTIPVSTMCDRATLALMKAKRGGILDCEEYDETMRHYIMTEQSIVNDMMEALQRGEFKVYMQPKYDAATERVVGAEALVRWIHPVRGEISPAEFIPVFEHNGFILKLDQFVWEETCRLLRKWINEDRNPPPVSVNVSRVDFYSTQLVNIIEKLVQKYHLPRELLELEITESAYTDNPQQIVRVVKELQQRGYKILMDDFGSGYSSLNMLKALPVDVLKLDLKFLDDKNETGRGGNILNSVVRMAKWMHLPVVVEGVETRQQVDFLRTIGCDYIQGYYFSRPIPVEDYEHLLAQRTFVPILGKESQWLDAQDLKELLNPSRSFNLLFNSMIGGVGLYEMMTGGSIELLRANDGFFRLMQSSKEDIDRIDMLSYIMDEDRKKILRAIRESGDRKKLTECIVRRRLPDGTFLWLRARVSSLFTDESRRLFFIGWDDVSSQYNLPLQLQAMTDQFQNGIVMSQLINGELYLNYANRWMLELDGLNPDSRRGQGLVPMTNIMDKELVEKFKEAILKHVESGSGLPAPIEYPFEASDGTTRILRCYLNATKTSENHYSVLASVHDITNETK